MNCPRFTPIPFGTLVEPCAGSAALTMHLLGARRAILPYQGGKWRYRHALADLLASFGLGRPQRVVLADPSPWGIALEILLDPRSRQDLILLLRGIAKREPSEVFVSLQNAPIPEDPLLYTAQFLFLQRLSHSGKAVGVKNGKWSSPGFNRSSAYGLEGTERFGAVRPMVPCLVRVLEGYDSELVQDIDLQVLQRDCFYRPDFGPNVTVYIDPPYQGTTPYPHGTLTRQDVVTLALRWSGGAETNVVVSEATPIPELVERGWQTLRLRAGRTDTSPFKGKQEEWVTYLPRRLAVSD